VKLLLDQNLSFKLAHRLKPVFGEVMHVNEVSLSAASDQAIWGYAKNNDYTILSKDSDFLHRALLFGAPPKVICLRMGNTSTQEILECLQDKAEAITAFANATEESVLLIP